MAKMKDIALLIGNDINNISPGVSWAELLQKITDFCQVSDRVTIHKEKPFPMLYEEIFLAAIKTKQIEERDLKAFIAANVAQIDQNDIHHQIRALSAANIMTTNYDYTLQGTNLLKNTGVVVERLYSIFRRNELNGTNYWHLHGEANHPMSINLGFEHYCGQLQNMRNYVVTGTDYTSPNVAKASLLKRLQSKKALANQSWIDLFFTKDIFILGLALDFIETDLWWLLTFRARSKFYKNKISITNKIYYYIPEGYVALSKHKLDLLKVNGVEVISIKAPNKLNYYHQVLESIDKLCD